MDGKLLSADHESANMSQVIQPTDDMDITSPEFSIVDKKDVPGDAGSESDDGLDEKYKPKQPPNEKERKSRLDELLTTYITSTLPM